MRMHVANAHQRESLAGVRHRSTAPQWRSVHSEVLSNWSGRLVGPTCLAGQAGDGETHLSYVRIWNTKRRRRSSSQCPSFPQLGSETFQVGVIDAEDRQLFWFAETTQDIWNGILRWYEVAGEPLFPFSVV